MDKIFAKSSSEANRAPGPVCKSMVFTYLKEALVFPVGRNGWSGWKPRETDAVGSFKH